MEFVRLTYRRGQLLPAAAPVWCGGKNAAKISSLPSFVLTRGAIAQLGERIVRNDEVVGSIPTSSTIVFKHLEWSSRQNLAATGH